MNREILLEYVMPYPVGFVFWVALAVYAAVEARRKRTPEAFWVLGGTVLLVWWAGDWVALCLQEAAGLYGIFTGTLVAPSGTVLLFMLFSWSSCRFHRRLMTFPRAVFELLLLDIWARCVQIVAALIWPHLETGYFSIAHDIALPETFPSVWYFVPGLVLRVAYVTAWGMTAGIPAPGVEAKGERPFTVSRRKRPGMTEFFGGGESALPHREEPRNKKEKGR